MEVIEISGQEPLGELDESILDNMGFEPGEVEVLELLKVMNDNLNMMSIREEYMNTLVNEFNIHGLEIETIIASKQDDKIPGTEISKHKVCNSVITTLYNKIMNTRTQDTIGVGGGKRQSNKKRSNKKRSNKKRSNKKRSNKKGNLL